MAIAEVWISVMAGFVSGVTSGVMLMLFYIRFKERKMIMEKK